MEFIEDPQNFILIVALYLLGISLYYGWTRGVRTASLKKLGFKITFKMNAPLVRLLFNFAPEQMTPPSVKTEKVRKKITKQLLIKWYAYKKIFNHEIHCWSYRLVEYRFNGVPDKYHWWQAILINGLNKKEQVPFIRKSRIELGPDIEVTENPDSILIIYRRPFFSFKGTLSFFRYFIYKIKLKEQNNSRVAPHVNRN